MSKARISGIMLAIAFAGMAPLRAGDWDTAYWGFSLGYGTSAGKVQFDPLPSAAAFIDFQPTTLKTDPKGVLAGFQIGHNWSSGSQVFGYEADLLYSGMKGDKTQTPIIALNGSPEPGSFNASSKTNLLGSIRGRYGFLATPQVYLYATGGLAFGRIEDTAAVNYPGEAYPASLTKTKTGWTAGLGGEWTVAPGVSTRLEFVYSDLGKESVTVNPTPSNPPYQMKYTFENKDIQIRIGMNYQF